MSDAWIYGRSRRPSRWRIACLILAIAANFMPAGWTQGLRNNYLALLAPAQRAAIAAADACISGTHAAVSHGLESTRIAQLEADVARLQLALRLAEMHDSKQATAEPEQCQLLGTEAKLAHVLGAQSRAFLGSLATLDVGAADGMLPGNFVVDAPVPLIDVGLHQGLGAGQHVLAGSHVWGRLADVGPECSSVRRVNAAGYRDLVQIVRNTGSALSKGPRGVLEGTGEACCRIKFIPISEPLAVGDLVVSCGDEDLFPSPLVYGAVGRVERAAGEPHWQAWMEPAAESQPRQVAVVRIAFLRPTATSRAAPPLTAKR